MDKRDFDVNTIFVWKRFTSSTNDDVKTLLIENGDPVVVIAEMQTAGKGQHGNKFYSPTGGLYFSLGLKNIDSSLSLLTTFAGVCVCQAIEEISSLEVQMKWVNDIYANGKKLCGILSETGELYGERYVIVGIGINCDVTPQIEGTVTATSFSDYGITIDRQTLCTEISNSIIKGLLHGYDKERTLEFARKHSCLLGKTIEYVGEHGICTAVADNIDDEGCLIVNIDGCISKLSSACSNVRVL